MTSIWMPANYLGANFKTHEYSRYFIHVDLLTGSFLVLLLWFFSIALIEKTEVLSKYLKIQSKLKLLIILLILFASVSTLVPNVVNIIYTHGLTTIHYGTGFNVYSAALLGLALLSIFNVIYSLKVAKGELKKQISTLLVGLIAAVIVVSIANLLIPVLSNSKSLNLLSGNLAYIGIVIFIASAFYSIVKHKLFDLRLILARTIAYTLSLTTFTGIYVVIALLVSSFLIKDYKVSARQELITLLIIFILALTINPVKRFFDRNTNKIFFRDSYSSEEFLDELNKTIIDNIEIGVLLRRAAQVIEKNLKCEKVNFALYGGAQTKPRLISQQMSIVSESMEKMHKHFDKFGQSIVSYDDFDNENDTLFSLLRKNNIAILAGLHTPRSSSDTSRAYIMLGPKKSGNAYSKQDIAVIEIIASELVIAIQNALRFEEIQNFNATLQERINEATRKLRRANEKLRDLDETKDDFISMASHQLRTPLTSVKGYISLVLEGDAGTINKAQSEMLSQAFFSSQRMVYLIADLLNVSRLKTGKFMIEPVKVSLADMVDQELQQLKETAASREVELIYDKPKEFPELMLDDTKTRQVVMNFVDNAIYYTPPGGKIKIILENKPATVELKVQDNGIGVPRAEQHHLFTKFYRAANARKTRPDGTGLGLFMAKKVIVAQSGSLIFQSKEGKGSTFGFVMSKSKLAVPVEKPTVV